MKSVFGITFHPHSQNPEHIKMEELWRKKLLQRKLLQKHQKLCKMDVQVPERKVLQAVPCRNVKRRNDNELL